MPEEQILSASRIKTWESCSWKFWCTYKLKLPRSQNDGTSRGTACHLVLEVLLNPRHKKYITKIVKKDTVRCVPSIIRLLEKSLGKDGFLTEDNLELCDNMIIVALNLDFSGGKGAKIDNPEEEFLIDSKSPRYKMMGYIDKPIQYKKEGRVKIVDYKTNKNKFVEDEVDYNVQAFAYLLAAKQIWPKLTDASIQFQFLKFPDDPCIEIKYSKEQLAGFEYYLEDVYNKINNFSEEDARSNFAKHKPFPKKKEGFTGPLNCGFAEYEGHLKKDGNPRWYCEHKFAFDYYSVIDENGNPLYSSKNKKELKPKKNQTIKKLHYSGCPAHNQPSISAGEQEDPSDFPF
jgi:hypothetical protein